MNERTNLSNSFAGAANKNQTVTKSIEEASKLQILNAVGLSSKLGTKLGETIGGFELIVSNIDDTVASVINSFPENIVNDISIAIAQMKSDVVGQQEKLVQTISSSISSDLQKSSNNSTLTTPGQLDVVITAVTPQAISAATKSAIPTVTEDEIIAITETTTDVNKVELPKLAEEASVSKYYNLQSGVETSLKDLQNRSTIESNASKNIDKLSSKSSTSYNSLLSTSYSKTVDLSAASIIPVANDSEALKALWSEGNAGGNYWNQVSVSPLEIKSEIHNLTRQVTEIVVASSNTGKDLFVNSKRLFDIEQSSNKVPSIHYVITANGIERLLPVDIEADQTTMLPYNHHQNSIIIMLVGGIKGPHPKETEDFIFGNTYTSTQLNNLASMFKIAYECVPGIQIFGLDLLKSPKKGPHIDIVQFTKTRFSRGLVNKDLTQGPYTADEIVNARI